MQGQQFKQSDEQVIQAAVAKIIKIKNGKLYVAGKNIKITLSGQKGDPGDTPVKDEDYKDGEIGKPPKHQWDGTKIRFEKPDGKWGVWVDLKGKEGDPGATPEKDVDYRDGEEGDDGVGRPPAHQWRGTNLRFKNPDGTWGEEVDLKGVKGDELEGPIGKMPDHEWRGPLIRFQKPDGSWSKWVDLKGEPGKFVKGGKGDKPVEGVDYEVKNGIDAVLPESEDILILQDADLVVGPTGKAALEKKFQNIKVVRL